MVLMNEHCQDAAGSRNGRLGFCVLSCVTQSGPKCQESLQWGRLTHSRNLLKRTISAQMAGRAHSDF